MQRRHRVLTLIAALVLLVALGPVAQSQPRAATFLPLVARAATPVPIVALPARLDAGAAVALGDQLLFESGCGEIWAARAAPPGAVRLAAFAEGETCTRVTGLATFGRRAFFVTGAPDQIQRVWRTDGTPESTLVLGTFELPGPGTNQFTGGFAAVGGTVTFARTTYQLSFPGPGQLMETTLWSSDGTPEGTRLIRSFPQASLSARTGASGRLYFLEHGPAGGLWASDGTAAGTQRVVTMEVSGATAPLLLAGTLYFGVEGVADGGLWASDGTAAGTRRLTALAGLQNLTAGEGRLWFSAGRDLWVSDGTSAGTTLVARLGLVPAQLVAEGRRLFFSDLAGVVTGAPLLFGLWASDGTAAGTVSLGLDDRRLSEPPVVVGGRLALVAEGRLYFSDGTPAGTRPAAAPAQAASLLVGSGPRLFFQGCEPDTGCELWVSDGSGDGTRLAHELAPGRSSSNPRPIAATATALFFTAGEGGEARGLWALPLQGAAER